MDIMIIIVCLGLGTVLGMYIASQIQIHIADKSTDEELMRNIERLEREKKRNKDGMV